MQAVCGAWKYESTDCEYEQLFESEFLTSLTSEVTEFLCGIKAFYVAGSQEV